MTPRASFDEPVAVLLRSTASIRTFCQRRVVVVTFLQSVLRDGSCGGAVTAVPTVVINEVLTHSDAPQEDAIELHNLGKAEVDLSGWFLSDSANNLKKYRIPDGTTIGPSGYHVFYEKAFLLDNGENGFSLSSARGDDVWLTQADAEGNLLRFVDKVDFGPAANGVSLGRYPNATGPLVAMASNSLGSNVRAGQDVALLNELKKKERNGIFHSF